MIPTLSPRRQLEGDGNGHQEVNKHLQARHPATAVRLARLIRSRLESVDAELWKLVRDGTGTIASQALLAAAIKHSPLLGDFLDGVVREQYRLFHPILSKQLWEDY